MGYEPTILGRLTGIEPVKAAPQAAVLPLHQGRHIPLVSRY